MADNRYLYQAIMDVPGLTGSWQSRNKQLYEKLGSPMGPYEGTYSQNIMLLNKLKENDYYKGGLPGEKPKQAPAPVQQQQQAPAPPQERIADESLENVQPNTDIYSEDVMKQDAWFDPFDEWTRNFVNTYMKEEWERDVYNPAMKNMTKSLGEANQAVGLSSAWRTSGARENLADMAKEMMVEEDRMRTAFQDQSVERRDQIRSQLAAPLYNANMTRWGDSPWGNMNLEGADMEGIRGNLEGSLGGENLNDLLSQINSWTPDASGGGTQRDWQVYPDSPYSPSLFERYTQPRY
jgi:hypothetical protein